MRSPRDGSSPRVRGKRGPLARAGSTRRLIPARAGKTTTPATGSSCAAAHPRACGENREPSPIAGTFSGSSPRVRGKHDLHHHRCGSNGLIPARAGKTCPKVFANVGDGAHPRACGENERTAQFPFEN
ncbi:hypothetical protein HMPREF9005_1174 [Actinomyces sp. oral taxon 178 str. F0338]|nr:hypothetical protein HMPREF9005_1174 [Actinomyces sp. oral taxon 178 str. F0338]